MNPSIFNFNNHGVRVALSHTNEPLFCLADVGKGMQIKNATVSRFKLNPMGVHEMYIPTGGGEQKLIFISEENLYRIVFRSHKKEALNFQTWVFAEVLPTIRKTGSYSARQIAFEELNRLCMQEKVSQDKGTFHSLGMHRRKHEKHSNAIRIATCKSNIQLAFEGLHHG